MNEHNLFDDSWPDFQISAESLDAVDRGTAELPASLMTLLDKFAINDPRIGPFYDIGRYELGASTENVP